MDFDKMKDKVSETASEHGDKVDEGVDKAAEFIDDKTGGEHQDKIDSAADKIKGMFGDDDKDDDR